MAGIRWKKVQCVGDLPEPRWGHTSSGCGSSIIIFGGHGSKYLNDLYSYDTIRNAWSKLEVRGMLPCPRKGHSTTPLPDGRLLVFGGSTDSKHYADVHMFEPGRLVWTKSAASPKSLIESRAGHTAVLASDSSKLIVFGGTTGSKYFSNSFILDIATLTWSKLEPKGDSPSKRGGHCAFLVNNKMFVFGGYDGKRYYNDLYCLNLDTFIWSKVEASGSPPKARSGHTATLINNGAHLLVFGGCGANSVFFSDVHILRTADMCWEQPRCLGIEPPPRFRHTCTEVGNLLYVFSGTGSGNLLSDMMILELDADSVPHSPSMMNTLPHPHQHPHMHPHSHTQTHTHTHSLSHAHSPHPSSPSQYHTGEAPEKPYGSQQTSDVDPAELRKLYFAAMMALKAEKQQREDAESVVSRFEKELQDLKHLLAVEKSVREAAEERLIEEHRNTAKLEQTVQTKIEKVTRKRAKEAQVLRDALLQEEQKCDKLANQIEELSTSFAGEKKLTKELKLALANVELRSQEGVHALTKELEEMRITSAHMNGQELANLSLNSLMDLEAKHTQAYQLIFTARFLKQVEEAAAKSSQLAQITQENQQLRIGKSELESKLHSVMIDLSKAKEELNLQQSENSMLKARASRLEGLHVEGLTIPQLEELENLHHEGLKRVSQLRTEHMQKEIEDFRKAKEEWQEKNNCIICYARKSNCVLIPCGHSSLCFDCSELLKTCPLCRCEIARRVHTYEK